MIPIFIFLCVKILKYLCSIHSFIIYSLSLQQDIMVKLMILEPLGIPRLRICGISIFNVVGTILFAYPLTLGLNCIDLFEHIKYFQTICLLLTIAPLVHYLIGDHTPLVKLIIEKSEWKVIVILMGLAGITGSITLFTALICFILIMSLYFLVVKIIDK